MTAIRYNFEYDRRLRACFIGAGGHSFRNIYPTFRYAPVELAAICDLDRDRASSYARLFGAERHYTDHREMLERERPEAVFVVTSYEPDGRVAGTGLAMDALAAGAHVWMEKPPAAGVAEVRQLMEASARHQRFLMAGLKKVFFPAVAKVKEIITSPEFGRPSSVFVRYPISMPEAGRRGDLRAVRDLLDHIYHPGAIIQHLMGAIERMSYEWEPHTGGTVTTMRFTSGAIGTLHLAAGSSGSSPLERLEVVGEGANVVLDNGVRLTYYRPATRPGYGRAPSYLVDGAQAPLHWEPEFSLGQLYNSNAFLLGYAQEVLHFCERILEGLPPEKGTLEACLEVARLFECYRTTPPGTVVTL